MNPDTRKQRRMLNENDEGDSFDNQNTMFDNDPEDHSEPKGKEDYDDNLARKIKPSYENVEAVEYKAELNYDDNREVDWTVFGVYGVFENAFGGILRFEDINLFGNHVFPIFNWDIWVFFNRLPQI